MDKLQHRSNAFYKFCKNVTKGSHFTQSWVSAIFLERLKHWLLWLPHVFVFLDMTLTNSVYAHSTNWQIRACSSESEYLILMLSKKDQDVPFCAPLPTHTVGKQQDKASMKSIDSYKRGVRRSLHSIWILSYTNVSMYSYLSAIHVFSSCLDLFWQTGICNTDRHQICGNNRGIWSSIFFLAIWGWTGNKNNIQDLQKDISPPRQVLLFFLSRNEIKMYLSYLYICV